MNNPDFLYHYTNVESLALILKNKTFRFKSLDQMDDFQEHQTSDLKNIGQFCFISSWTNDNRESIPMWNMYASLNAGVRIRLKTNPFKTELITEDLSSKIVKGNGYVGNSSCISINEMVEKKFLSLTALRGNILFKVEYTDEENKLYPKICSESEEKIQINLNTLGKCKNTYWSFQEEWRYIFTVIPITQAPITKDDLKNTHNKMISDGAIQPFSYYDLSIDTEAFSDMEITLSPKISAGNREIVYALVSQFNQQARVLESTLSGKIQ